MSCKPALSALALIVLSGCAASSGSTYLMPPAPPYSPPKIVVTATAESRVIYIKAGSRRLPANSRTALESLIENVRDNSSTPVHIKIISDEPRASLVTVETAARDDGIAGSRVGYISRPISLTSSSPNNSDFIPVKVIAISYQATPPKCPSMSGAMTMEGSANQDSGNFGCAVISNFLAQVQDPADLLRGQGGGTTDSVLTNAAIERLDSGSLKALLIGSFAVGG